MVSNRFQLTFFKCWKAWGLCVKRYERHWEASFGPLWLVVWNRPRTFSEPVFRII